MAEQLPVRKIPTLEHTLRRRHHGEVLTGRLQGWYNEVQRWRSTKSADGYTETLLGHVRNMNGMVDKVADSPTLSREINLPRLNLILGVHDLGEVGTGDIDRAQKEYEGNKKNADMTESQYFLKIILPALPYVKPWVGKLMATRPLNWIPTLEKTAHKGFLAYEGLSDLNILKKSHDKEALLAKVMDRMDAVTKGVEHFHVGKTGDERKDAVIRQLAGANRASSLHLYRLLDLFGQKGNIQAIQDLGQFMLDYKNKWDMYDPQIFDTPRTKPLSEQLPSFAESLGEIGKRYGVEMHSSQGKSFTFPHIDENSLSIGEYMQTATSVPQRL